ncbi:DUF6387 family protein [Paraburkholderia terrae]
MAPKRAQRKDIPQTFSVDKYKACKHFGWHEWYVNLEERANRLDVLRLAPADIERIGLPDLLRDVFAAPFTEYEELQDDVHLSYPRRRQVESVTAGDLLLARMLYFDKTCDHPHDRLRQAVLTTENSLQRDGHVESAEYEEAQNILRTPVYEIDEFDVDDLDEGAYAFVDLSGPEEKLVDDFREWLKEVRKARGCVDLGKRFTQADFDDWHRYKILAYIDLTTWARHQEFSITHQLMGVLLFPEEYSIALAERVRKTVAPLAQTLLMGTTIDAIRSQALEAQALKK